MKVVTEVGEMNCFHSGAVISLCLIFSLLNADRSQSQEQAVQRQISKAELEAVAKKRVVFAHQSVGYNILEGASKLAADQGVALSIVETRQPSAEGAGIFHFTAGQNGAPDKKISDYADTVSAANFPEVDVALMKLCYVDFSVNTDGLALAKSYTDVLQRLQKAHPATRFVAVTAPLTTVQSGAKAWVKGLLGRPTGETENGRRHQFNEYLRQHFGPGLLFDLAKIESEATGASREDPPALQSELTNDGGHLNEKGQRLAGAAFLKLIALPQDEMRGAGASLKSPISER